MDTTVIRNIGLSAVACLAAACASNGPVVEEPGVSLSDVELADMDLDGVHASLCFPSLIAGFAGVLMILRPGTGTFSPAASSVLFAALCYACLAITARKLAPTESTFALSVYVIAGPMIISGLLSLNGNWLAPDAAGWTLFLVAGVCSVVAWIGLVGGYRRAPPAVLAPFEYTALIAGAVAGYLIWGEVPDRWVVAGGLVIILSGLYIVYREVGAAASMRYLRSLTASGSALLSRRWRPEENIDP